MKKIFLYSVILILFSCGKKSKCFKFSGNQSSENKEVDFSFSKICVYDNINVTLIQGTENLVKITAGENLLPFITVENKGEYLELKNTNKCDFLRLKDKEVTAEITVTNLEGLFLKGYGAITCKDTLFFSDFTIDIKDALGDINLTLNSSKIKIYSEGDAPFVTLKGKSDYGYFYAYSVGRIMTKDLKLKTCHVNHSGNSDIEVNVEDDLFSEIHSNGNIVYYGSPEIHILEDGGSGKLIHK